MTESSNPWAELEAKEIRLWIGELKTGLWCPTCLLPSGYCAPIQRDPADPPVSWIYGCAEDKGHASQVAQESEL